MANLQEYGYGKLREYIQANWKYLELQDSTGMALIRLGVGDSRITWVHQANAQTLQLQIIVNGSDLGATSEVPKTVAKSAIYDVAVGGSAIAVESLVESDYATLTKPEDKVTLVHDIQVPVLEAVIDDTTAEDSGMLW